MSGTLGIRLACSLRVSQADELQARTDAFADLAIRFIRGLPDTSLVRRLAGQCQDAGTSTAANYRAARRARSHAEFTAKMAIVSEEADESVFWLTRMVNANIASETIDIRMVLTEAEQLARIFGAAHRTARRKRTAHR
jgi:four helix bundle protein